MDRRYGSPHTTVAAYRREIKKWPLIKPGDSAALKKFYSFLIKCQSITPDISWNALNTPDTLCSLLAISHTWHQKASGEGCRICRSCELC